ncbi:MAG: response regulator transcription factor [Dinghuibacter sp.]|nr:response regulator transcription factor [Dinghuibacter sp.]
MIIEHARAVAVFKQAPQLSRTICEYLAEKGIKTPVCITDIQTLKQMIVANKVGAVIADVSPVNQADMQPLLQFIHKRTDRVYTICCFEPGVPYFEMLLEWPSDGILTTDHSLNELVHCLSEVYAGKRYCSQQIRNAFFELTAKPVQQGYEHLANSLTQQECRILSYYSSGLTNKEVINELNISIHTLNNHKTNIRKKLNLASNSELHAYILKNIRTGPKTEYLSEAQSG